ncbi:hypothetical protein HK405_015635, partial [Cladochytrium tenue]
HPDIWAFLAKKINPKFVKNLTLLWKSDWDDSVVNHLGEFFYDTDSVLTKFILRVPTTFTRKIMAGLGKLAVNNLQSLTFKQCTYRDFAFPSSFFDSCQTITSFSLIAGSEASVFETAAVLTAIAKNCHSLVNLDLTNGHIIADDGDEPVKVFIVSDVGEEDDDDEDDDSDDDDDDDNDDDQNDEKKKNAKTADESNAEDGFDVHYNRKNDFSTPVADPDNEDGEQANPKAVAVNTDAGSRPPSSAVVLEDVLDAPKDVRDGNPLKKGQTIKKRRKADDYPGMRSLISAYKTNKKLREVAISSPLEEETYEGEQRHMIYSTISDENMVASRSIAYPEIKIVPTFKEVESDRCLYVCVISEKILDFMDRDLDTLWRVLNLWDYLMRQAEKGFLAFLPSSWHDEDDAEADEDDAEADEDGSAEGEENASQDANGNDSAGEADGTATAPESNSNEEQTEETGSEDGDVEVPDDESSDGTPKDVTEVIKRIDDAIARNTILISKTPLVSLWTSAISLGSIELFQHLLSLEGSDSFLRKKIFTLAFQFIENDKCDLFAQVRPLLPDYFDLSGTNDDGHTMLSTAINGSNREFIDYLLKNDASQIAYPGDNTCAFYFAATSDGLKLKLWDQLLALGCDPLIALDSGADNSAGEYEGFVVYHIVARNGATANMRRLLELVPGGRDARDCRQRTPLHVAAEGPNDYAGTRRKSSRGQRKTAKAYADVVRMLAGAGADMNAADEFGRTPLDVAVQFEQGEIADEIRRLGGRPGKADGNSEGEE